MTDRDLELLDGYLDGALSDEELRQVEERLEKDVLFIGELARMRSDRDARLQAWESMQEPGDEYAAIALMGRIDAALDRRESWASRFRWVGRAAAAAALILVGFMGDAWLQRHSVGPVNQDIAGVSGSSKPMSTGPKYRVMLKDSSGKIIAVNDFDSKEKAEQFRDAMNKWQENQWQMQNGAGAGTPAPAGSF